MNMYSMMTTLCMPVIHLWSHMLVKTANTEEAEVLEEMSEMMQLTISESQQWKQQQEEKKKKERAERRKNLTQMLKSDTSTVASDGSFLKVGEDPVVRKGKLKDPTSVAEASSTPLCYCGLETVEYVCRQAGINYLRRFRRCPRKPSTPAQCHFFMWLEATKSEQFEDMTELTPKAAEIRMEARGSQSSRNPSSPKEPRKGHKKKKSRKPSTSSSSSEEAALSSPKGNANSSQEVHRGERCQHHWSKRGANAHQEMKTCKICGERQIYKYRTMETIKTYVDPSTFK